jgi:hypothetical protein
MKPIAVNSLFRWIDSLFGARKFRVPNRTGNLPQRVGIAERIDVRVPETGSKAAEILQIPCYFPCWQGIRGSRSASVDSYALHRHARACSQVFAGYASLPARASTPFLRRSGKQDVDGRNKPGHDSGKWFDVTEISARTSPLSADHFAPLT